MRLVKFLSLALIGLVLAMLIRLPTGGEAQTSAPSSPASSTSGAVR